MLKVTCDVCGRESGPVRAVGKLLPEWQAVRFSYPYGSTDLHLCGGCCEKFGVVRGKPTSEEQLIQLVQEICAEQVEAAMDV